MDDDVRSRQLLLLLAVVMLLAAAAVAPGDLKTARFFAASPLPGDLHRVVQWSEAFAHGLGVALIGAIGFAIDPPNRRYWPRILATAYAAGLSANVAKLVVGRWRPNPFFARRDGEALQSTFVGWLPLLSAENWDHAMQSFPSAHTATAVGLACALSAVYRHATWLFALLAALAGLQRIDSGAHFFSDVLSGAAIGFFAAAILRRQPRRGL